QSQLVVNRVQSILDYDRVMLYMFDEEWNGEVIAEKTKPGVRSYLHHHFPASDIPAPARALLEKKQVRQIPDVNAGAIDIFPYLNPATGAPTNILQSELRNPSEIHLEYLQNMEVSATLSLSVMVKGKLWGLITCHNLKPVFIDYWKRQLCYAIAKAYANAVLTSREKRDVKMLEHYKQLEEALIVQLKSSSCISEGLFEGAVKLPDLTEASGAAVFVNGQLSASAGAPDGEDVMEIIDWLVENNTKRVFSTRQLSAHMPAAARFREKASGLLALEISRYNKEYILYFKPEITETRIWAGNPDKPQQGADRRIHPRKSFKNWEEVIRGKSQPWKTNELEVTEILLKDITALLLRNQAEQLRQLNQELSKSSRELRTKNSRLEDFAYIVTHNLR
ncbi:MAG: GAF domain-containing protein, partial [Pontibacter sp.]|nr:GAF domain-containing protein [Pontibacter sp.]